MQLLALELGSLLVSQESLFSLNQGLSQILDIVKHLLSLVSHHPSRAVAGMRCRVDSLGSLLVVLVLPGYVMKQLLGYGAALLASVELWRRVLVLGP